MAFSTHKSWCALLYCSDWAGSIIIPLLLQLLKFQNFPCPQDTSVVVGEPRQGVPKLKLVRC